MDEFIAPRGWLLPLEPLEELHTHQRNPPSQAIIFWCIGHHRQKWHKYLEARANNSPPLFFAWQLATTSSTNPRRGNTVVTPWADSSPSTWGRLPCSTSSWNTKSGTWPKPRCARRYASGRSWRHTNSQTILPHRLGILTLNNVIGSLFWTHSSTSSMQVNHPCCSRGNPNFSILDAAMWGCWYPI